MSLQLRDEEMKPSLAWLTQAVNSTANNHLSHSESYVFNGYALGLCSGTGAFQALGAQEPRKANNSSLAFPGMCKPKLLATKLYCVDYYPGALSNVIRLRWRYFLNAHIPLFVLQFGSVLLFGYRGDKALLEKQTY